MDFTVNYGEPLEITTTPFQQTPTGLIVRDRDIPVEAFESMLVELLVQLDSTRWQLGDLVCHLEERFAKDDDISPVELVWEMHASNRSIRTVEDWAYVAAGVPYGIRRHPKELPFSHHRVVVPLRDMNQQNYWLEQAVKNGWSEREFTTQVAGATGREVPPTIQQRMEAIELDNADLHRRLDNLIRERETIGNLLRQAIHNPTLAVTYIKKALEVLSATND